jgi:hypothetical protein
MTSDTRDQAPLRRGDVITDPAAEARLRAAERRIAAVAWLLDNSIPIPGTGRRFGIEPIIGLIPGAGDLLSAGMGVAILFESARFRLPPIVMVRMVANTLLDLAAGTIPFLGDLFDFAYKSNSRNLELFRRYAQDPGSPTGEHRAFVLGLVLVIIGALALALTAIGWLLNELLRLTGG